MTPGNLFHGLLGLGLNWKVDECEFKKEDAVVLLVISETEHLWESERCPGSGGRVKCYEHVDEMVWRHLNVFEHQCEIRRLLPRGRCESTGKIYRVTPPWEGHSKHFTKSFEAMALLLLRESQRSVDRLPQAARRVTKGQQMPLAAVGRIIREHDTRLWRMLKAHVAAAYPQADWSEVSRVGCDEMSVRKGHHYVSIFATSSANACSLPCPARTKKCGKPLPKPLSSTTDTPERSRKSPST